MAIRVAGYAKLAKLWEKDREEALAFHRNYFKEKFPQGEKFILAGSYIDVTGNKNIKGRPEMLRLISDCMLGKVDLIFVQTKGYLAANTREFCFLLKLFFEMSPPVDILTEDPDYRIDTLTNADGQKEQLLRMADNFISLDPEDFSHWKSEIAAAVDKRRKNTDE